MAAASLTRLVEAEAACVQAFVDVLEKEQQVLAGGSGDAAPELSDLSAFAEQKATLATKLAALAKERGAALSQRGYASDRRGIDAWAAQTPADRELSRLWTQLSSLATKAREINRVNGELIAMRMQYNARALEALRGGSSALDLYGPDGQATGVASRRIDDAV